MSILINRVHSIANYTNYTPGQEVTVEQLATSNIEITSVVPGDLFEIRVDGNLISSYTVLLTDNIAAVIDGLIAALGGGFTGTRSGNYLILKAPIGSGFTLNTIIPVVTITGTGTTGSITAFAGGAAVGGIPAWQSPIMAIHITDVCVGDATITTLAGDSFTYTTPGAANAGLAIGAVYDICVKSIVFSNPADVGKILGYSPAQKMMGF